MYNSHEATPPRQGLHLPSHLTNDRVEGFCGILTGAVELKSDEQAHLDRREAGLSAEQSTEIQLPTRSLRRANTNGGSQKSVNEYLRRPLANRHQRYNRLFLLRIPSTANHLAG